MRIPLPLSEALQNLDDCQSIDFRELVNAVKLQPMKDFVGVDLSGVSLEGEDVSGFDFSDADLRRTNIRHSRKFVGMIVSQRTRFDGVDRAWLKANLAKKLIRSVARFKKTSGSPFRGNLRYADEVLKRRERTAYVKRCREDVSNSLVCSDMQYVQPHKVLAIKHIRLGMALFSAKRFREAIKNFRKAHNEFVRLERIKEKSCLQDIPCVLHLLSLSHKALGNVETAKRYINRSLRATEALDYKCGLNLRYETKEELELM